MKQSQVDKKPLRRWGYTLAATLSVVTLGFALAFFQSKDVSAPVHAKIVRQKIVPRAVNIKPKNNRLADDRSPAPVIPSQQTSTKAEIENTVVKKEAFVSVDRLVPKKTFSYNKSTPKLAVLKGIDHDFAKEKPDHIQIIGVTAKEVKKEFTLVLLADRAINGYKSFFLDAPPRLIVDLSGQWNFPQESKLKLTGKIAKSVRFGKHSDFLRIVIDLTGSASRSPKIKTMSEGLFVALRGI